MAANDLAAECHEFKEAAKRLDKLEFGLRVCHSYGTHFGPIMLFIGFFGPQAAIAHPGMKAAAVIAALMIGIPPKLLPDAQKRVAEYRDSAIKIAGFFSRSPVYRGSTIGDDMVAEFRQGFRPFYPVFARRTDIDWKKVDWHGTMACESMVFKDESNKHF